MKGPWSAEVKYESWERAIKTGYSTIRDPEGNYIGQVLNEYAHPIAAMPDLLAVLKILVDHAQEQYPHFESDRGQRDISNALFIIAQAEGKVKS